jgi:hypothetical protein
LFSSMTSLEIVTTKIIILTSHYKLIFINGWFLACVSL